MKSHFPSVVRALMWNVKRAIFIKVCSYYRVAVEVRVEVAIDCNCKAFLLLPP